MKKLMKILSLVILILVMSSPLADAHSGRTDANGGHNCSAKSKAKGLCTGYHYHNGGSSTTKSNKSTSKQKTESSSSSNQSNNKSNKKSSTSKKEQYTTSNVQLFVNEKLIKLDHSILVKDSTNYFPIRNVADAIGTTVSIDSKKKMITLSKNKVSQTLTLSSSSVITRNNVTYAPIRDIVSGLDVTITYDQKENSIYLSVKW